MEKSWENHILNWKFNWNVIFDVVPIFHGVYEKRTNHIIPLVMEWEKLREGKKGREGLLRMNERQRIPLISQRQKRRLLPSDDYNVIAGLFRWLCVSGLRACFVSCGICLIWSLQRTIENGTFNPCNIKAKTYNQFLWKHFACNFEFCYRKWSLNEVFWWGFQHF